MAGGKRQEKLASLTFSTFVLIVMLFPKNANPERARAATLRGIRVSTSAWCAYACIAPLVAGTGFSELTVLCQVRWQ